MRGPSQRSAGCDRQAWQHNLWLPKGLQPGGDLELTLGYKPSSGLSTRYGILTLSPKPRPYAYAYAYAHTYAYAYAYAYA